MSLRDELEQEYERDGSARSYHMYSLRHEPADESEKEQPEKEDPPMPPADGYAARQQQRELPY